MFRKIKCSLSVKNVFRSYYKLDRHRKPATMEMVVRGDVCAMQSCTTLDWLRVVCIRPEHDYSIFELIDSGERVGLFGLC